MLACLGELAVTRALDMTTRPDTKKLDSRTSGENERRILRRDPNPHLFRPLKIRSVTVRNRIMLSPMCQYSASDGMPNEWHFVHLGARAVGGAGIVSTEAVHTEPRGRITKHCLGLWSDEQRDALKRIAEFVELNGATPAIQLGHAGRKASVGRPWEGSSQVLPDDGGWQTIGASSQAYANGFLVPKAMSRDEISKNVDALVHSVRRAREAGFKILEIHAAHGYLFHQFFSPLSNLRTDKYGGSFENRVRFFLESLDGIRAEWPSDLPLFVRLSVTDWVEGGWDVQDSVRLCNILEERGDVDLIDCSSGGNDPRQKIPIHPGYQTKFSQEIKQKTGLLTASVGLINSPDLAEAIIANGWSDVVALGRTLMSDPHWPLRAANALKHNSNLWPEQYERSNIF